MESNRDLNTPTNRVQFNAEEAQPRVMHPERRSWMVRLLIKISVGVIKNAQQANIVLVGIAILSLLATGLILWTEASEPPLLPPADDPV